MANQPEIADLVKNIAADVTTIVNGELELAKAELVPQAKSVGIGAGLFGAAGYFALSAVGLLWVSLAIGFAEGYRAWMGMKDFGALAAGFATMTVLMLIIAGVLALVGKNKVTVPGPEDTIRQGQESVEAVKIAVVRGKGLAEVEADDRRAARKDAPMLPRG